MLRAPRKLRARDYTIRFTDHANFPSLMVYMSDERSPLPRLWNYVIYFTHPETNFMDVEPTAIEFLSAIVGRNNGCDYRLDMHFLPDAGDEECIAHFKAELAARGSVSVQISALDLPEDKLDHDPKSLPGLVPSYDNTDDFYENFIFIVPTRGWNAEGQLLRHVCFGPMSDEQYQSLMEEDEVENYDPLAPFSTNEVWLRYEDGAVTNATPPGLRDCFNIMETNRVGHFVEEVDEAWQRGVEDKGWETWPIVKV